MKRNLGRATNVGNVTDKKGPVPALTSWFERESELITGDGRNEGATATEGPEETTAILRDFLDLHQNRFGTERCPDDSGVG
ncbi:MAG: hypothetical protein QOI61_2086 [Actinomycetota bacterium]|jgi:hypothetical protein